MDLVSIGIGIVIGVFANLITPSVRKSVTASFIRLAIKANAYNARMAAYALKVNQEDLELITKIHNGKHEYTLNILSKLFGMMFFITFFVLLWFIGSSLVPKGPLSQATLYGGLGGVF